MRLYFPESKGQIDYVGYNHAIKLVSKALADYIVDDARLADYRLYFNLPWHHDAAELREEGLPLAVYTMYESTAVPRAWVRWLNRNAAVVLVPSEWCRGVFLSSGVKRPVYVVSLGYDPEAVPYTPKSRDLEHYVFAWQGVAVDFGGRKGAGVAVQAFKELREEGLLQGDARLIVKTRPNRVSRCETHGATLSTGITYIQADLTRQQLLHMYQGVDCCINPTHGEGFGLIPLEQAGMGKPVIATAFSLPYFRNGCFLPLEYDLKQSPVTWNHKFLSLGLNGVAWNAGGLMRDLHFLPTARRYVQDHKSRTLTMVSLLAGALGEKPGGNTFGERVKLRWNWVLNRFADFQRRTGFMYCQGRRLWTLYQENPGIDAWVKKESLKEQMLWCYRNRSRAEHIGFVAHHYVSHEWCLDRIRKEYEAASNEIRQLNLHGGL